MAYTHFTLEERIKLESSMNQSSLADLANLLNKNPTTISREIKKNLFLLDNYGLKNKNDCLSRYDCKKSLLCYRQCTYKAGKCRFCGNCNSLSKCPDYLKEDCAKLKKFPFCCNGCLSERTCTLPHFHYSSSKAHKSYGLVLRECRSGVNLTEEELADLDRIISRGVSMGQSIHNICINNKDVIMIDEKTVYNLIDANLIHVKNMDLSRKCRLNPKKENRNHMKVDKKCRLERTFHDFEEYLKKTDYAVVEMDSDIGKRGGKAILTLFFRQSGLQLYFIRDRNDSASVIRILDELYELFGAEEFKVLFPVLLGDNGSEFSNPMAIEFTSFHEERTKVFYCNPGASYQKGSCERNHELFRYYYKKGESIDELTQEQLNLINSHMNSYQRKKLNNQSPIDMFSQMYGSAILDKLGLKKIEPNLIILNKDLIK